MLFIRGLVCVCLITYYVTTIHGTTKLRFNKKLHDALMLNSIPGISFEECRKECTARKKCRSISYKRTAHHGYLVTEDAITNPSNLVTSKGYIYGDRTYWNMTGDVGCTDCLLTETCWKNGSIPKCEVRECGVAPEKQKATKFGNMMVVGSIVKYVCSDNPCSVWFSTCQTSGQWSNVNDTICETDLHQLEGKKFHITNNSTNEWWHMDESKGWIITTSWGQGSKSDQFTEISFVRLMNSKNRFKIRMNSTENFVVKDGSSFYAYDNVQQADIFTIKPSSDMFRLFHEATQSFVYVDDNKQVTTSGDPTSDRTVFKFEEL